MLSQECPCTVAVCVFPGPLAPLSRAAPAQRLMHRALCGALLSASLLARASATVRRCPCHRAAWCPPLPALTPGRAGIDVSRLHRLHGACCARAAPRRCRQRQLQPRLTRISAWNAGIAGYNAGRLSAYGTLGGALPRYAAAEQAWVLTRAPTTKRRPELTWLLQPGLLRNHLHPRRMCVRWQRLASGRRMRACDAAQPLAPA